MNDTSRDDSSPRGRGARRPMAIPPRGWKDILKRVKDEVGDDRVSAVAASVAFFGVLAIFPSLIALVSLYGLVADPADIQAQVKGWAGMLPPSARSLLTDQLQSLVDTSETALGFGVVLAILGALWSASSGMKAVMEAINIAYDEEETRGFLRFRLEALQLTLGALAILGLSFGLLAALPLLFGAFGLGAVGQQVVTIGRWPLMGLLVMFWLAVLYRRGPDRDHPQWRWVTWGAFVATVMWLAATGIFSFYVTRFGSYNETYGAIGGVIVFMLWLYISAFVVLLGAELNSEIEHQTAKDTTVGPDQPMGERGAVKADTLPEPPLSQP